MSWNERDVKKFFHTLPKKFLTVIRRDPTWEKMRTNVHKSAVNPWGSGASRNTKIFFRKEKKIEIILTG